MSSALALAAVTALIKDLLDNALVDASINSAVGSAVTVTALPPDLVDVSGANGPQLNVYLYRVAPNQGWRNQAMPSRASDGTRLTNAPLALDLYYLVSAYGTQDYEAEILLGYAMQQLHERPILTPSAIRVALAAPSLVNGSILPPALSALAAADLAEQVETVKITPETLGIEDVSKLWSAFQANHRPSAAYRASVVLIESQRPVRAPLPVLTIGASDRGPTVGASLIPPFPTLEAIEYTDAKPSAYLGESLGFTGHHLDADAATPYTVELAHADLAAPIVLTPSSVAEGRVIAALNMAANAAPAGVYGATLRLVRDGSPRSTNTLPLVLAPRIDAISAVTAGTTTTFTVQITPEARLRQSAALVVGTREIRAQPYPAQTGTLTFEMDGLAAGTYAVRLRMDGIESVLIDRTTTPPTFFASQQVSV